jgi:hypothetical protein
MAKTFIRAAIRIEEMRKDIYATANGCAIGAKRQGARLKGMGRLCRP